MTRISVISKNTEFLVSNQGRGNEKNCLFMKKQEWPSQNSVPDWRNIIQFHLAKCNRIQICSTRAEIIQLSPKDYVISWQYDVITDHQSFSWCQYRIFSKSTNFEIQLQFKNFCVFWWKFPKISNFWENIKFPMRLKIKSRVKSVELTSCGMTTSLTTSSLTTCLNPYWSKWYFAFELREIHVTRPRISSKEYFWGSKFTLIH